MPVNNNQVEFFPSSYSARWLLNVHPRQMDSSCCFASFFFGSFGSLWRFKRVGNIFCFVFCHFFVLLNRWTLMATRRLLLHVTFDFFMMLLFSAMFESSFLTNFCFFFSFFVLFQSLPLFFCSCLPLLIQPRRWIEILVLYFSSITVLIPLPTRLEIRNE